MLAAGIVGIVLGAAPASGADRLAELWPGVRDSSEQVVMRVEENPSQLTADTAEMRVRTAVSRVDLPWLGARVLYLEEYLPDDTSAPRRQILLQLEPDANGSNVVRTRLFTFRNPERWRRLSHSALLLRHLRNADIERAAGCDLVLQEEGTQFRGGTEGNACRVGDNYVDYRTVIGENFYWYRRRIFTVIENELQEEVVAFNWFEPNDARLFTCRVEYSASGKPADRRMLVRLDLHDQGGHERFATPDGRGLELSLHSQDGPFAADRDALILVLRQQGTAEPIASAWTELTARQIALDVGWLTVRCGPLVPQTDELES
jgi:hypothetical protein